EIGVVVLEDQVRQREVADEIDQHHPRHGVTAILIQRYDPGTSRRLIHKQKTLTRKTINRRVRGETQRRISLFLSAFLAALRGYLSPLDWSLSPRNGHGRRLTMAVAAPIGRTIFEIGDEAHQLLDGFPVGLPAFLGGRQL